MRKEERKQNNKGFSLVELIIVIAIMAVLVAILAPAFMRYVEESRQKADITAVDEVVSAVKAAYTNEEFSLSGASVTVGLTKTADPTITPANADLSTAMTNSDVHEARLKSSKWGTVEIKFEEASTGALKASVTSTGTVKMESKYNKK